jgi:hypothetical protein
MQPYLSYAASTITAMTKSSTRAAVTASATWMAILTPVS